MNSEDRRRLDLVEHGATPHGGALCCDATLVFELRRTGHPQRCTVAVDGAVLRVTGRRKHAACLEFARAGSRLVVLGSLPVERGGAQLPPQGCANEGPSSPTSHPRGGRGRLDAAMVEHAVQQAERWQAMVVALRSAAPPLPHALAHAIQTVAELEAWHGEEQAVGGWATGAAASPATPADRSDAVSSP